MTDTKKEENGSLWNMVADIGNGRQLSVNWNGLKGATTEEISAEVDKYRSVFDKQQAKAAALAVQQEIDQRKFQLAEAKGDMARIDGELAGKGTPPTAQREQRKNAAINLDKMQRDIDFKTGVLSKLLDEAK